MKYSATNFLQAKLGRYTYLYRISVFIKELQSDVTIGTIIVNIKDDNTIVSMIKDRTPTYFTSEDCELLKNACIEDAKNIHHYIA